MSGWSLGTNLTCVRFRNVAEGNREYVRVFGNQVRHTHSLPAVRPDEEIRQLLAKTREELGLALFFVGEMRGEERVFRYIDGDAASFNVREGLVEPADQTYCRSMLAGTLPQVVTDARRDPRTAAMPITEERSIGSYVGVPIELPSGRIYGTLCALDHESRDDIDEAQLRMVRFVAGIMADHLASRIDEDEREQEIRQRVESVLTGRTPMHAVYQPIVNLATGDVAGYESLARFPGGGSPADWFEDAWDVGLGVELELQAAKRAVAALDVIEPDRYLAINASPRTILSRDFGAREYPVDIGRILVEVTEHEAVRDYSEMQRALVGLRDRGVRLAIDDAGAGFSTLSHIVHLSPDVIKLDVVFSSGIEDDPARRAITSALVTFAKEIGASIVAEGIETNAQLEAMRALGVGFGQGYGLGRPAPLEAALLGT